MKRKPSIQQRMDAIARDLVRLAAEDPRIFGVLEAVIANTVKRLDRP